MLSWSVHKNDILNYMPTCFSQVAPQGWLKPVLIMILIPTIFFYPSQNDFYILLSLAKYWACLIYYSLLLVFNVTFMLYALLIRNIYVFIVGRKNIWCWGNWSSLRPRPENWLTVCCTYTSRGHSSQKGSCIHVKGSLIFRNNFCTHFLS